MKIIDLSTTLIDAFPTYPGDPSCQLRDYYTIENDGFRVSTLSTNLHTGTHMDAPAHYIKEGSTIEQLKLEDCIAEGILLDVRQLEVVDMDVVKGKDIASKILLLYAKEVPLITKKFIDYLVKMNVKIIGINTASIDYGNDELHTYCLERNLWIVENICNLEELSKIDTFTIYLIPIKIKAEASFVRAFAICK